VGQRRAIADLAGTTRTTLYVHAATGNNTVPTLTGMTEAAARAAIIAAGFTVGTVTQTVDSGASGVSTQGTTGVAVVGTPIAFTVNTQTIG
jgi:beta-lactam-binding protein with PASTA domain